MAANIGKFTSVGDGVQFVTVHYAADIYNLNGTGIDTIGKKLGIIKKGDKGFGKGNSNQKTTLKITIGRSGGWFHACWRR